MYMYNTLTDLNQVNLHKINPVYRQTLLFLAIVSINRFHSPELIRGGQILQFNITTLMEIYAIHEIKPTPTKPQKNSSIGFLLILNKNPWKYQLFDVNKKNYSV